METVLIRTSHLDLAPLSGTPYDLARMLRLVATHSVCLAESEGIIGLAVICLLIVLYLSWANFGRSASAANDSVYQAETARARGHGTAELIAWGTHLKPSWSS